ncbi:hypothetical protein ACLKA7_000966 [Drosophila subpalustris]
MKNTDGIEVFLEESGQQSEQESSSDEESEEEHPQKEQRGRGRPKLLRSGQPGRPRKVFQPAAKDINVNVGDDETSGGPSLEDMFLECEMVFTATDDPTTYQEAKSSDDSEEWMKAVEDEFMAQVLNNTWNIVERPTNRKVIGNRMVFRTKGDDISTGKKKALTTRPDIAYAVSFLSQFNANYNGEHWKAAKRILRYLNGTRELGLLYVQTGDDLYGVVDADWGGNISDRRSYTGQAFILAGAAISWEARKQRSERGIILKGSSKQVW